MSLSGIALVLGLTQHVTGLSLVPSWLPFAVAIALGVVPIARRALTSIRSAVLDINVLMLVAVGGAIALGEWGEAASVVFLFAVAQMLESRAMERARGAIAALMDLAPSEATVRRGSVTLNRPRR